MIPFRQDRCHTPNRRDTDRDKSEDERKKTLHFFIALGSTIA